MVLNQRRAAAAAQGPLQVFPLNQRLSFCSCPSIPTLRTLHAMSQTTTAAPSVDETKRDVVSDVEQPPVEEKHDEPSPADASPVNPWHPSQFPDGGKAAYLTLLGGFCCLFCSFGWLNCVGVFQNYYQQNQLREYSPSTIAWIPSIQIFLMFLPGPIVGWVFDNYGPRYLLLFGTFFHVFGLMMTSLCTEYYQFILVSKTHCENACEADTDIVPPPSGASSLLSSWPQLHLSGSNQHDPNLLFEEAWIGLRCHGRRVWTGRCHLPNHGYPPYT